ncbi:MAG: efflux RND transporter periplasmic adaptor subunit [Pseudomonadota bacterium]
MPEVFVFSPSGAKTRRGFHARRIAVVALTVLVAACGRGGAPSGPPGGAAPVQVAAPSFEEVTVWDEYVGHFEAVNRVEVRPRVSGFLDAVHFEDGAIVEEGDLLFTIDPRPFEAELDGAKARARSAQTTQQLASAELARAKKLLDARAGSQEEFDQRLQAKQAADAEFAAANAAVRQAELNVEFTQVRAPIAGRAGRDLVNKGNLVGAQNTLLTTIVSIDPIHFVFTGSERDYLNYARLAEEGERKSSRNTPNPVRIKLEDQDDYLVEGRMNFVNNELNTATGTISAQAIVKNEDGFLTPGMFGRLRLYGRDPFDALVIPDAVVQFDQSQQFVWVVGADDQGTSIAEMRPVRLGRLLDGGRRIIEQGLSRDDRLIVSGFAMVRPGAPITPIPVGAPAMPGDAS